MTDKAKTTRGLIPFLYDISEEDIESVVNFYRYKVTTTLSAKQLRPYAINSLVRFSKKDVLRKIAESPAKLKNGGTNDRDD